MDGWNTTATFLLRRPIFRGYVSFRQGKPETTTSHQPFSPFSTYLRFNSPGSRWEQILSNNLAGQKMDAEKNIPRKLINMTNGKTSMNEDVSQYLLLKNGGFSMIFDYHLSLLEDILGECHLGGSRRDNLDQQLQRVLNSDKVCLQPIQPIQPIHRKTHVRIRDDWMSSHQNCGKKLLKVVKLRCFSFTLEYIKQVKPYPPKDRNPDDKNQSLVNNHMPNYFFKVIFIKTKCP